MKKDPHDEYLKNRYQTFLKKDVAYRTWEKVKQDLLACGLNLNERDLEQFARFRKEYPRLQITKDIVIKAETLMDTIKTSEMVSAELMKLLKQSFTNLEKWQYYRCFENVKICYSSNQKLPLEICKKIILMGAVKSETANNKKVKTNAQQNEKQHPNIFKQVGY